MIAQLRGKVLSKYPFNLVLDCAGVGYDILCTQEAYGKAPDAGKEYTVVTRLIVREDSQTLYGFASQEERELFDRIISVSGIGPKTGLAIVSALGAETLKEAIRSSNIHTLTTIPGVGRKTAERMIVELRDRFAKEELTGGVTADGAPKARQEALAALVALGYARADAEKAIREVLRESPEAGVKVETLIKAALKQAAK
jgi:holliday junction DNA helicase RuvA